MLFWRFFHKIYYTFYICVVSAPFLAEFSSDKKCFKTLVSVKVNRFTHPDLMNEKFMNKNAWSVLTKIKYNACLILTNYEMNFEKH